MQARHWFVVLALSALAAVAGLYLRPSPPAPATTAPPAAVTTAPPEASAVSALYASRLPDLAGHAQPLAQWRGKVTVINFWAPWCGPCRQEVPALTRAFDTWRPRNVAIVGIAVDSAENVRQFDRQYRINYPLLLGDANTLDLAAQLGDKAGGLPYTVIIDRHGAVAATFLGGLTQQKLDAALAPLAVHGA